jgi:EAL domain-containing protein (putative c-di-GMP-specific phosphodiesterase class I)
MEVVRPLLMRLKAQGFSLALDDFGTGYSSLSYLRHLPFQKVKIDRSFVIDADRDPKAARMLESIVQLCVGLGMHTVAEGVETTQQLAVLRKLGVHEFQGYLFAKPMPVEQWVDLLAHESGNTLVLPRL